jgi:hypothetical protein
VLDATDYVYFAHPAGLYQFDRNAGAWNRATAPAGLLDSVQAAGVDDGLAWAGTAQGVVLADVRARDWRGLAGPVDVGGFAFDPDYAWIAAGNGLWRYDKFSETFDSLGGPACRDALAAAGAVWLATDSGAWRWLPEFERLEPVPGAAGRFQSILATPARLFFIGTGEALAVERATGAVARWGLDGVEDVAALGDSVFAVVGGRVLVFDPKARNWGPLRDVEYRAAYGISAGTENLLVATDAGIIVYNWADRTSRTWNRASGLEVDSLLDCYEDGRFLYALGADRAAVLDKAAGTWRTEGLTRGAGAAGLVWLDDNGAHLKLIAQTDLRLAGRAFFSSSLTLPGALSRRSDYRNINLGLVAEHSSGRSLRLFFDDTDKDQVLYGLGYRGTERDLLNRADAGFLDSDYFEYDLAPAHQLLGGRARLRAGQHSLSAQAGALQSRPERDFFTGRRQAKRITLADRGYARRIRYRLRVVPQPGDADTVFSDDRNAGTDGPDTEHRTVAGIEGDYDPLLEGTHYFTDYRAGVVQFAAQRGESAVVALSLDGADYLLQGPDSSTAQENAYFFGPNIIPGSFELVIRDTLGNAQDPAAFGLDTDRDGMVDPQFVNHDLGWLVFPDRRPFPAGVYEDSLSLYALEARYESRSAFYSLSARPLVKNSETVLVDAEPMARGTDYIVDYTSGTLLFLRDDAVTEFSAVEVRYSAVARDRGGMLASVQPLVVPVAGIQVAPGFTHLDSTDAAHLSARWEPNLGERARLRLAPQAAVDLAGNWAQAWNLTAGLGPASVNAAYRGYAPGFAGYGAEERRYGRLEHGASAGAAVEPVRHLKIEGRYDRDWLRDSAGAAASESHAWAKAGYSDPRLPSGWVLAGTDAVPDYDKLRLRAGLGWGGQRGRVRARLDGTFAGDAVERTSGATERNTEVGVDANFSLGTPLNADVSYRRGRLEAGSAPRSSEEVRARLNLDVVPGLYWTGAYDLAAEEFGGARGELDLAAGLLGNLHIAPGRWVSALSIVNLSVGAGTNFSEYLRGLDAGFERPWLAVRPLDAGQPASVSATENLQGTVQLTPVTGLSFWARRQYNRSATGYYSIPGPRLTVEDRVKVDWEPGRAGLFTSTWERRAAETYPQVTTNNVYFEWNRPWTDRVRTKLLANWRGETDRYIRAELASGEVKASAEGQYRVGEKSYLRARAGGSRASDEDGATLTATPGAGLNLNLWRFLYLQFDYDATVPLGAAASHLLSFRITGQF